MIAAYAPGSFCSGVEPLLPLIWRRWARVQSGRSGCASQMY
jgi:hypothetical protein